MGISRVQLVPWSQRPSMSVSHSPPLPYCCPGETQPISQAVHLGRLATFYPACRSCPHAQDTGTLSPRVVRQIAATQRRARRATLFHDEGIAGAFLNEVGPAETRRAATALALLLRREAASDQRLEMVLGCDGRPIAAEISAAASEALRQAGCNVLDIGFTTAGVLADSIGRLAGQGGIYIGRGDGGPQQIALSFFGQQAIPWSAGGGLDQLSRMWHAGFDRPSRSSGTIRRHRAEAAVQAELTPHFHALRPLRLVLDTASLPLRRQLCRLAQRVSLEIIDLADPVVRAANSVAWASSPCTTPDPLQRISDRIVATSAHFGLWIDGDGVRCRLFDEQGGEVPAQRLAAVLLRHFHDQSPDATLVVQSGAAPAVRAASNGNTLVETTSATRESFARTMLASGAVAGADLQGRGWFGGAVPVACALRTVAVLLTILSHSDRRASEVLVDGLVTAK